MFKLIMKYVLLLGASILFSITSYYAFIYLIVTPIENLYYYVFYSESLIVNTITDDMFLIGGISLVLFLIFSLIINLKFNIKFKDKLININRVFNNYYFVVGVFLVSIFCLLNQFNVGLFLYNKVVSSSFFEDNYVNPSDVEIVMEEKPNLIHIYLESFESGLASKENGGFYDESVIPNLEKLALDNVNFSHNDKVGGGYVFERNSWTVSGMIGQTAGVTLNTVFGGGYTKDGKFMDNLVTMGDILLDNGYKNYMYFSTDALFGARKEYFETNGDYEVYDYFTAIEDGDILSDYFNWLGFEDKLLLDIVKDKITEVSKNDDPFNFSFLTIDTHFPNGYIDDSCDILNDSSYLNSFSCSDLMIYELVEWIKNQEFYEDTVIVITGDHNSMQIIDKNMDNKLYNVVINSRVDGNTKNREFSSLDLFPTILASMGASIEGDRLGLGVNLYSSQETLIEKYGYKFVNKELLKNSEFYNESFLTFD